MIAQTAVDLIDMGNLALQQGNVALARWQYEESFIIWRALDDAPGMAHALARLGAVGGEAGPRGHHAGRFGWRGDRS